MSPFLPHGHQRLFMGWPWETEGKVHEAGRSPTVGSQVPTGTPGSHFPSLRGGDQRSLGSKIQMNYLSVKEMACQERSRASGPHCRCSGGSLRFSLSLLSCWWTLDCHVSCKLKPLGYMAVTTKQEKKEENRVPTAFYLQESLGGP